MKDAKANAGSEDSFREWKAKIPQRATPAILPPLGAVHGGAGHPASSDPFLISARCENDTWNPEVGSTLGTKIKLAVQDMQESSEKDFYIISSKMWCWTIITLMLTAHDGPAVHLAARHPLSEVRASPSPFIRWKNGGLERLICPRLHSQGEAAEPRTEPTE